MGFDFSDWSNAWSTGFTPWNTGKGDDFFRNEFSRFVSAYNLNPHACSLVPLAGTSPVVRFLYDKGHTVTAVEWVADAIERLKQERFPELEFEVSDDGDYQISLAPRISIYKGDFLKLKATKQFDLIYDRASLVALTREQRQTYATIITDSLKVGGLMFVRSSAFDFKNLPGPPYSVPEEEVLKLYQSLKLLEKSQELQSEVPDQRFKDAGVTEILHTHYLFQRL